MKKCPFCAEEIQQEAIKCKHCFEFLDESKRPQRSNPPPLPQKRATTLPWQFRTPLLVILILSVGPLALPLVWLHPTLTAKWKSAITAAVLLMTWGLWFLTKYALKSLNETLEIYKSMNF